VAAVEHGRVTGVAPGNAVITALCEYAADGENHVEEYSCPVEVAGVQLENAPETALQAGETAKLTANLVGVKPENAALRWSSSDESVARVRENGVVEAVAPGSAQITVVCEYGEGEEIASLSASVEISVAAPVKFEILSGTGGAVLPVEGTLKLAVSGFGEGLEDYSVAWSSADAEVASVDATGCVTGVSKGATTVFAQIEYVCGGAVETYQIPFELTVGE